MRLIDQSLTMPLTCTIVLSVVLHAFAQSTPDATETHAAPYRAAAVADVKQPNKVEHLHLAVQHLTAAGQPELARTVATQAQLEEILAQIRQLRAEVAKLRGTTTPTDQTVTLHVQIMELQVARMKELGFDFSTVDGVKPELVIGDAQVTLGAANGLIAALQQQDLVKVLAEPTLVTVSGRPASFRTGGEFPIVVPQSLGTQSVEYRQYGTRLDCVANVLDSGRIRLELRANVSELDPSRSVVIHDTPVPGLRSRSVDTAVEMAAGQTVVLSGMRQSRPKQAGDAAPDEETSLLVAVTATVGEPVQRAAAAGASTRR